MIFCNGSTDYVECYAFTNSIRAFTTGVFDVHMSVIGPL